ncbi:MAG: hypothetical protein AB7D00_00410 [Rhodospirillaceae bacterium]
MTPLDLKAPWIFARGGRQIVARPIAVSSLPGRQVVILRDTAESLWVAEWTPAGGRIASGPVSLAEAVRAAEGVVFGAPDHGSVAALTGKLALGLLIFNVAVERPDILDPARYPPVPDAPDTPEVRPC